MKIIPLPPLTPDQWHTAAIHGITRAYDGLAPNFRLIGYVHGWEAKLDRYKKSGNGNIYWLVPREDLHPWEDPFERLERQEREEGECSPYAF
jgi:hypothetical protein